MAAADPGKGREPLGKGMGIDTGEEEAAVLAAVRGS